MGNLAKGPPVRLARAWMHWLLRTGQLGRSGTIRLFAGGPGALWLVNGFVFAAPDWDFQLHRI